MRYMTGADLFLKAMEVRSNLPVIFYSGHSELINRDKALAMGIKEYFEKPLSTKKFLYTVRSVLDNALHQT